MKVTVNRPVDIDVQYVRLVIPVGPDGEDMPEEFPFRQGNVWDATIDISTGEIVGWPKGVKGAKLDIKVRDEGSYYLLDADMNVVGEKEEDYVPDIIPNVGDYVTLEISDVGLVRNFMAREHFVKERIKQFFGDDE